MELAWPTTRSRQPHRAGRGAGAAPAPRHGGPLALLRFMRANHMLSPSYAVLLARYALLKLRFGGRLQTDGICFICPGVKLEIGRERDAAHRPLGVDRARLQGARARGRGRASARRP